jgi:hypothetical protein
MAKFRPGDVVASTTGQPVVLIATTDIDENHFIACWLRTGGGQKGRVAAGFECHSHTELFAGPLTDDEQRLASLMVLMQPTEPRIYTEFLTDDA